MFRTYDDWKLATPPEYDEDPPPSEEDEMCSGGRWCDRTCCACVCPCHDEEPPMSLVCIQLDDRNDPPML